MHNPHTFAGDPDYGFMRKAEAQMSSGVKERITENLERNLEKTARKSGLV